MTPFWASLFEYLKDCGRNATLFIVALAGIAALFILASIIQTMGLSQYLGYVWPPLAIAVLIWSCFTIRRGRARRRERLPRQRLSPNELHTALSKLKK